MESIDGRLAVELLRDMWQLVAMGLDGDPQLAFL
jgi:hypothetical protein